MTLRLVSIVAATGLATSLACQQSSSEAGSVAVTDTAADRQAIERVREREIGGFVAGTPDSVAALVTDDFVFMPPNEPAIVGRDSARTWLKRMADQFTVSGRYTDSRISVVGDWAIERFNGELTLTPKGGGQAIRERLKGIHIYRRQPDGSWQIAQDVWNSSAPPAAAGSPAPPAR